MESLGHAADIDVILDCRPEPQGLCDRKSREREEAGAKISRCAFILFVLFPMRITTPLCGCWVTMGITGLIIFFYGI